MDGFLTLIIVAHAPDLTDQPEGALGEALCETVALGLLPAINLLSDLHEAGAGVPVGLAISPALLDQLADRRAVRQVEAWLDARLAELRQALAQAERADAAHVAYLARFDADWLEGLLRSLRERHCGDLAAPLRALCADLAEPLCVPASHPYLPLISPASAAAQITIGQRQVARHMGRAPEGIWLPECGFTPTLLDPIAAAGLRYLIVDPGALVGGADSALRPRQVLPGALQALQRAPALTELVWSAERGYPGDPLYRAERVAPGTGMRLWRHGMSPGAEELYDPYDAFRRAEEHAAHFLSSAGAELARLAGLSELPGAVVLPIDCELLGRAWFEGAVWLRALLERSMQGEGPALAAPGDYLRIYPPRRSAALRDSSWGPGGTHAAWDGPATAELRAEVAAAELRLRGLAERWPDAGGARRRALGHALRALLRMQSSDWPLLAGRGEAGLARAVVARLARELEAACAIAERERPDEALAELDALDHGAGPPPDLDLALLALTR